MMNKYHELPAKWVESLNSIKSDISGEYFTPGHIRHYCLARIDATLATKGGWRNGCTWGGNYRITVTFQTYGRLSPAPKYFGYARTLEGVRCVLDRALKSEAHTRCERLRLVTLYRDMLGDKRAAKRHQAILNSRHGGRGWLNTKSGQRDCFKLLESLLRRRGWSEQIDGWHNPDGRIFDDLGYSGKVQWVSE